MLGEDSPLTQAISSVVEMEGAEGDEDLAGRSTAVTRPS
jgi:hypothetical protein